MNLGQVVNHGNRGPAIAGKDQDAKTRLPGSETIHLNRRQTDARGRNRSATGKAGKSASAVNVDLTNEAGKAGATQRKVALRQTKQNCASHPSNCAAPP